MPGLTMRTAILTTVEWIESRTAMGEIWPSQEPFVLKRNIGAYFTAQSSRDSRLTWVALQIALEGLYQVLWQQGRFNVVAFDIYETAMLNLVGVGRLEIEEAGIC